MSVLLIVVIVIFAIILFLAAAALIYGPARVARFLHTGGKDTV